MIDLKLITTEQTIHIDSHKKETIRGFVKITRGKDQDFNCVCGATEEMLKAHNNVVYMVIAEMNTSDSENNHRNSDVEPLYAFLDKEKARNLHKIVSQLETFHTSYSPTLEQINATLKLVNIPAIAASDFSSKEHPHDILNRIFLAHGFGQTKNKSRSFRPQLFIPFINDLGEKTTIPVFWDSFGYSLNEVKIMKRIVEDYGDEDFI